jgi:monofunctional biosynthetic peptidoglycan transglycosylase
VDLNRISPNLPLAVVASEDQKFPEHWGFDVESIEKAYALNQHSHRVRGASTISQQVAKNLFLWSGRSYFRKGLEAYFTVLIEGCWPKRRILEIYLNIAEFGHGTYGAEAPAQRFFRKSAARLSRGDAAVLAAVLPNPVRLSAAVPSRYVQQRRDWILGQMQALGGSEMLDEIDAYSH